MANFQNKIKFNDLESDVQWGRCMVPMLVFGTLNPDDETSVQVKEKFDRFSKLEENVKDKLASMQTAKTIETIGKQFGLSMLGTAPIARVVRSYYFGDVSLEQMPAVIAKETGLDIARANEITNFVRVKIIGENVREKATETKIVKMSFAEAIKQFPAVYEQLISSNPINVENPNIPSKPTLRNWISDYINTLGTGRHASVEISRYLHGNKSTRGMTFVEKQRLFEVIRSMEEGMLLNIDASRNRIIFEADKNGMQQQKAPVQPQPAVTQRMVPSTPNREVARPQVVSSGTASSIKRAQNGNHELSSRHHREESGLGNGKSDSSQNASNISRIQFGAPHRLSNERDNF